MYEAFIPWSVNDALDRLTFQAPIFYMFNDPTQFLGAGIKPAENMTPAQRQADLGITFYPSYTVIFEDTDAVNGLVQSNYIIENVTAHEAGHWVDHLYAIVPNAAYVAFTGSATKNDEVSITITSPDNLPDGPEKVTYKVGETDTLADVAAGLANAVNDDENLRTAKIKVVASASSTNMSIDSVLPNGAAITSYTTAGTTYSTTNGATEILKATIGVLPSATNVMSGSTLFADELAQDWTNFNALSACGGSDPGSGIFSGRQDKNNVYFCDGTNGNGGSLEAPCSNATNYPNNQVILIDTKNNATYGDIFGTSNELIAEEFAVAVSKTDDNYTSGPNNGGANKYSRDYYLQHAFTCTQALVGLTAEAGVLPTTDQWPGNCPKQ